MRLKPGIGLTAIAVFYLGMPGGAWTARAATRDSECQTGLASAQQEGAEELQSLAHATDFTPQQLLEASQAVRLGYRMLSSTREEFDERLAVAEQNFLHRGRENHPQAVQALERFAAAEITRSHASLTKLQKVITESVEWSRSVGVLRRLELDELAWLTGDGFDRLDIYGPAAPPLFSRLLRNVKSRWSPSDLQFVRAESFARQLRRLPSGLRLAQLKQSIGVPSLALGWNEVVVVLGAFDPALRPAALEVLRPRIFAPIAFFSNEVRGEITQMVPTAFDSRPWHQSPIGRRIVGLGVAAAVAASGVGAHELYERVTLGRRALSDGTTVAQKRDWVSAFKNSDMRAKAVLKVLTPDNLKEMTVAEAIFLAGAFTPDSYIFLRERELHDHFLSVYAKVHPELSAQDLQKLAEAAKTLEGHDALLLRSNGVK